MFTKYSYFGITVANECYWWFLQTNLIEGHIEKELSARESNFSMSAFMQELAQTESLDGEVFDLLLTFTDFLAFKTAMLETKQVNFFLSVYNEN